MTAYNNLGDVKEKLKEYKDAIAAYKQALAYEPSNETAKTRTEQLERKVERLRL